MEKDYHEVGLFAFYLFTCACMEVNVLGSRKDLRMSWFQEVYNWNIVAKNMVFRVTSFFTGKKIKYKEFHY